MAENETGETGAAAGTEAAENQQSFKIQRIYLKDVSFESPLTPKVFAGSVDWQPQVALNLNTESTRLENNMFECVLSVTVTVKLGEETAYLAEVKQAGLFVIEGFEEGRLGAMLGSFCPNLLFPYSREAISSLVQKGGFPQFLLEPVNFDALYAQHLASAKQNAPAPETSQ